MNRSNISSDLALKSEEDIDVYEVVEIKSENESDQEIIEIYSDGEASDHHEFIDIHSDDDAESAVCSSSVEHVLDKFKYHKKFILRKCYISLHNGVDQFEISNCKKCKNSVRHRCCRCQKYYSSELYLKYHACTHENDANVNNKPYICEECGKAYTRRSNLIQHQKIHSKYSCLLCPKTFKQKSNLNQHLIVHQKNPLFKCGKCGKTFTEPCHLKYHVIEHGKNFNCKYCRRKCGDFSVLKNHYLEAHADKIPYKCKICKKTYKLIIQLKQHERVHVTERPFACEECGIAFKKKSNLTLHLQIHSDEMFFCDYCGNVFNVKCYLRRHIFQYHI